MKKILILLLALVMCVGLFTACTDNGVVNPGETTQGTENGTDNGTDNGTTAETDANTTPDETATLAEALAILKNLYKDANELTERDYDIVGQVKVGSTVFKITWTCDKSEITIKESSKPGFFTVDVPDSTEEEIPYVLTATITDDAGQTETYTMNRKVPVVNNAGIVTEPEENVAYKFFMKQANVGKTLYALGEMSGEKFIKSTNDAKLAPDFYVEKVEGGFKFYTTLNGVKTYINARTTTAEDGKVSKYLELSTEAGAVWSYVAEVNAWMTTIGDETYCVGTYNTFDTFCISEKSYINADNTGVSQFPAGLITKEVAESLTPDEGPEDPTEIISIKDFLAIADKLANQGSTPEKYIVKGVITEIKNTTYGNLYIADEEGNQLYIYGLYDADGTNRFDKMNPQPKVGDTITVMGIASQYNGSQMKNGWVTELVPGEGGGEEEPSVPAADKTIVEFNEIAAAQPDKGDATTEKYTVTGEITEIKNTTYGNLYIKDAEGNQLYIYGLYNANGTVRFDAMNPQPKVGDTITVVGVACNYNGPQMKNGWVTKLNGEDYGADAPDVPAEDKTIPAFNEIAAAQPDKGDATTEKYTVTGEITEIKNTIYGNLYIKDAEGNQLYIYGIYSADGTVRFDAMNPQPKVGDTITVVGVACNYNGPQMKNGWVIELVPGEDTPDTGIKPWDEDKSVVTHLSFDELRQNGDGGKGVFAPGASATWDKIATIDADVTFLHYWGWVGIKDATIGQFGYAIDDNAPIFDSAWTHVTEQGVIDAAAGTGAATASRMLISIDVAGLTGEHTVKVCYKNADDTAVVLLTEFTVIAPAAPEIPSADKTIVEFNEIAAAQPDKGDATTEKYTVTGVISEIKNTTYGNLYIKDAEGNQLYIYGIYSADGTVRFDAMNPQPKVGDTITVVGVACNYNGPQMKNGWVTELIPGEPAPDDGEDTPPASDATATITFADAANRTEMSEEKQVWVANGITLTNDRGASTQPVKDYVNPVRIYAHTNLTVSYTGMTKIVFTCAGDKNIKAEYPISSGTLTVDGAIATITFDAPVDSVTFTDLPSQIRIAQIDVYA